MKTHTRYYIERISDRGSQYREATGNWVTDIRAAATWANKDFVDKKARDLKKIDDRFAKQTAGLRQGKPAPRFFVGTANVTITGELTEILG